MWWWRLMGRYGQAQTSARQVPVCHLSLFQPSQQTRRILCPILQTLQLFPMGSCQTFVCELRRSLTDVKSCSRVLGASLPMCDATMTLVARHRISLILSMRSSISNSCYTVLSEL